MSEKNFKPINFKHSEIFLGCYFTDYLIENYKEYLNEDLSKLAEEIELLRVSNNEDSINSQLRIQLKNIFHIIVSVTSANIEGNTTSVFEYMKTKWDNNLYVPPAIKEIQNLERAIAFVEHQMYNHPIDKEFICKLHSIIVDGLQPAPAGKGAINPGKYRTNNPIFENHSHLPPHWEEVEDYMDKLIEFINQEQDAKYDLLRATIAQHRLVWIHPFENANGRLSRLITYAMILKASYADRSVVKRNPALVLCHHDYYTHLAQADKNTDKGLTSWIEFIFNGLKDEVRKLNTLMDYSYLKDNFLKQSVDKALKKKLLTEKEAEVLNVAIEKQVIQAADVKKIYTEKADAEISREIKRMIDKNLLIQESIGTRKYVIKLDKNFLLSEIIDIANELDFLSVM